jgi:hypothetical protein
MKFFSKMQFEPRYTLTTAAELEGLTPSAINVWMFSLPIRSISVVSIWDKALTLVLLLGLINHPNFKVSLFDGSRLLKYPLIPRR